MEITINGQLLLSMLIEQIMINTNCKILQANTDGFTFIVKKDLLPIVDKLKKDWENLTNLQLENVQYSKMIIRDVNNYMGIYINGKTKLKGLFELDKDWHKDDSMKIVRIALFNYYTNGIPVNDTIENHNNIYDYCLRFKSTKGWQTELHHIKDSKACIDKHSKNLRYFVSKNGGNLYKHHEDGRLNSITKGFKITPFNQYYKSDNYNIDYSFYKAECSKILEIIEDKQLTLKLF